MRIATLKTTLSTLIDLNRPALVEGSPGLGKTQVFDQVCTEKGIGFIHFHAPTLQPEDLALPATNASKTAMDFLVSGRFPLVGRDDTPDRGVILIDELSQGDVSIQKTCANLIQEREIHGHHLKPGWVCMATGNKQSDRAGANRVLSHLSNRVTRLTLEANLDDWCAWALANGVKPEVVSFLRFKPGMLFDFDPNRDSNATPRAWTEGVSPIVGAVPPDAEMEVISGAVGEGPAAEFCAFLKIHRKLPNPDAVLMNPDTYEVPEEASVRYALAGAIAHRATDANFERVIIASKRLPPEFMVLTIRDAILRDKALQMNKAFIDWSVKDGHIIH